LKPPAPEAPKVLPRPGRPGTDQVEKREEITAPTPSPTPPRA